MPTTWTDTFIGTAGATLAGHVSDTGQTWIGYDVDPSATTGIILDGLNDIYAPAFHEVGLYLLNTPAAQPVKQKVQATLTFPTVSGTHTTLNLYARHDKNAVPANAHYVYGWCAAYADAPGQVQCGITLNVAGGSSGNGNNIVTVTPGAPVVVALDVTDCGTANLYINGVLANSYSWSATALAGGGYVGLLMERNALGGTGGSGLVSNFSALFTEGTGPCYCDVTVTPSSPSMEVGSSLQFSASGGSTGSGVTWSVQSGGGSITSTGLYTAPQSDATAVIRATSVSDPTCHTDVSITVINACQNFPPQMWLFGENRDIERWQPGVHRDQQVGTDTTSGTAIPDWTYSTGWERTAVPSSFAGVLVDADADVTVTLSKTTTDSTPDQSRTYTSHPPTDFDEDWHETVTADLKAYKWRIEFSAANSTTLRFAAYAKRGVAAVGG